MRKLKKFVLLLCLCLISACSVHQEYGFVKKNGSEIVNRISNQETFLVMISHEDSYSCDVFMEESESVLEEKEITVYVVEESEIEDSIKDQLEIALGDYSSWPALFYVKDGSISMNNKYEYSKDPEGWKTWFQSMGFLQEEN